MKTKVLWALVALNVLLLVGLIVPLARTNVARAQANARPSEYLMIPGEVIGGNSAVIYVVDEEKQLLSAVALDQKGNGIDVMQPIELRRVFEER
jgi:hypothetical protein